MAWLFLGGRGNYHFHVGAKGNPKENPHFSGSHPQIGNLPIAQIGCGLILVSAATVKCAVEAWTPYRYPLATRHEPRKRGDVWVPYHFLPLLKENQKNTTINLRRRKYQRENWKWTRVSLSFLHWLAKCAKSNNNNMLWQTFGHALGPLPRLHVGVHQLLTPPSWHPRWCPFFWVRSPSSITMSSQASRHFPFQSSPHLKKARETSNHHIKCLNKSRGQSWDAPKSAMPNPKKTFKKETSPASLPTHRKLLALS